MKRVDWKKEGYELIRNIISLIRYYEDRTNIDSKNFCSNRFRRFKIEQYVRELRHDLDLQWRTIRFLRRVK